MALKVHLRANKEDGTRPPFARCAARSVGGGKVRSNGRASYQNIPLANIVGRDEFRAAYASDPTRVCAHCCDAGLIILNRQRREKGKPPVASFFE